MIHVFILPFLGGLVLWVPAPILFCLLVSLTIGFVSDRLTDENGLYWALISLAIGLVVYTLSLKYWLRNAFSGRWLWGAVKNVL